MNLVRGKEGVNSAAKKNESREKQKRYYYSKAHFLVFI